MDVAYVAQTESCVFLLDGDGFCRATVPNPTADDAARSIAKRCIDAQYVASLDLTTEGVLVSEPKAGRQMLFAKVNAEGKVALIRTGSVLEMRSLDGPMPVMAPPVPETFALDRDPDEDEDEDDDDDDTQGKVEAIDTTASKADKPEPIPVAEPSERTIEARKPEAVEAAHAEPAHVEPETPVAPAVAEREAEKVEAAHPRQESEAKLPAAEGTDPEPSEDDCMELTAPFSRERAVIEPLLKASAVVKVAARLPVPTPPKTAPALAPLAEDDDDHVTRIADRESQNDNDELTIELDDDLDNAKTGERTSALPESRPAISAGPVTVQAPRTVRGFPPPPPAIPIAARRGILPRRW